MASRFTQSLILLVAFLAISQKTFSQTANAGPDQSKCSGNTATMAANAPTGNNKGKWTYVSGVAGTFAANDSLTNVVFTTGTATPSGTTTLRWTIEPGLVISQVYGGGGTAGATYTHDFVELHNRSSQTISLAGYSIQYASSAGNFTGKVDLVGDIAPGKFYLLQLATSGVVGVALPTPDHLSTAINMSTTAGKVALFKSIALPSPACGGATTCTAAQLSLLVDLVAYGAATGQLEGSPTAALSVLNSARRNPTIAACFDTNNNSTNFTVGAVLNNVRNSASALASCTDISTDDMVITWVSGVAPSNTVIETSGTANDGTISCGASAAITATGGGTYAWSNGQTTANINVSPTVTTTYTCTVTNVGCPAATTSATITVNPLTVSNSVVPASATVSCGSPAAITATGGGTYAWSNGATTANINVSPTTNTTYTCTVTNGLCSNTTSRAITVNPITVSATVVPASATVACGSSAAITATGGTSFLWSTGETTATINPTPGATTTYTCTVTNAAGCSAIASQTVTVVPFTPSNTIVETSGVANDAIIGCGTMATITASGGANYVWSSVPSGFYANTQTINVSPTTTTTYSCMITSTLSCGSVLASTSRTVTVTSTANTTVTETSGTPNDAIVTCGSATNITASAGAGYIWYGPTGYFASTATVTVNPTVTTTYYCTVTSTTGCAPAVVATTITVTPISASYTVTETSATPNDGTIFCGHAATISASGGNTYSWISIPAGFTANTATINVSPTTTTTYSCLVTNSKGCVASNIQPIINVIPIVASHTVTETSGTPNDGAVICGSTATITAEGGNTYSWTSIPAGFTATTATINVTPTTTTTYSCVVSNGAGCATATTQAIISVASDANTTVTETSGIPNDGTIICGQTASIEASSLNSNSYQWTSSPAGFAASTATINVTPTATTTYTCQVKSAIGCVGTSSKTITITPQSGSVTVTESSNVANNGIVCAGDAALLNATIAGATAYSWASIPSGLNATTATVTVNPTTTTTYRVTVTKADGCLSVAITEVTVTAAAAAVVITETDNSGTANDGAICIGGSATLSLPATPSATYSWSSTPAGFTSALATVVVSPTINTTYSVTATLAGCSATSQFAIAVNTIPSAVTTVTETSGIASNDNTICNGATAQIKVPTGAASYVWSSVPAHTPPILGSPTVNVAPSTNTTFTVTVTGNGGCSAVSSPVNITVVTFAASTTVIEPFETANDGIIGCNTSTTITASGAASYLWSTGATTAAITVNPLATTTYTCTVTSGGGCTAVVSRVITLKAANITVTDPFDITTDGIISCGSTATLTTTGGGTYLWSNGATTASINVSPTGLTSYRCTVTSALGCVAVTGNQFVSVVPFATIATTETSGTANDGTVSCGVPATLTSSPGLSYIWYDAHGYISSAASVTVTPTVTTTYACTVTPALGCPAVVTTKTITVTPITASYTITETSATPNDGTIVCGTTATITANGGSGVSYSWISIPAGFTANTATINVTPTTTTTYSCLISTVAGCTPANIQPIINVVSDANTTVTETSGTPDDGTIACGQTASIQASALNSNSYQWFSAPSVFFGNTATINVSPTATTTYTCQVKSAIGCVSNIDRTITIIPQTGSITVTESSNVVNNGIVCPNDAALLNMTTAGAVSYSWESIPAGLSATTATVTVNPSVTTTYKVTVTKADGCLLVASKDVTVAAAASTVITEADNSGTANDGTICIGGSANLSIPNTATAVYAWESVPAGFTSALNAITVSPTVSTTYKVTATINNCPVTNQFLVTVSGFPSATTTVTETSGVAPNDGIICSGATAQIAVPSGAAYVWASTPASALPTTASISVTPAANTSYTVTVTNAVGCSAVSVPRNITVNVFNATVSTAETFETANDGIVGCSTSTTVTAAGGTTYLWSTGVSTASITVNPQATTTYSCTVSNASGCSSVVSRTLTLKAAPITVTETFNVPNDATISCGSSATLSTTGGGTYLWSNGATTASITVNPTATTSYRCTVTSASGCVAVTANQTITVVPFATIATIETSGTANDGSVSCGAPTTLTSSPGLTYIWYDAHGYISSAASVTVTPTVTTTYACTVTPAQGCPAVVTTATITVTPITASYTITETSATPNDGTIACGTSATITASGGTSYAWISIPAGFTANTATINVTPTTTTTYSCLVGTVAGCTPANIQPIINVVSDANTTVTETSATPNDGTIICGSTATIQASSLNSNSYQWYSDASGFFGNTATINVSPTATTTYICTVKSAIGCVGTTNRIITVIPQTGTITVTESSVTPNDKTICPGSAAMLDATVAGATSYVWETIPAGFTATTATLSVSPTITTTYKVTVTKADGCLLVATTDVTVAAVASAVITETDNSGTANDGGICMGGAATLTILPTATATYSWTSTPAGFTSALSTVAVSPTVNTTYNVTTTLNGCTATSQFTVPVNAIPSAVTTVTETSAVANNDNIICNGASAQIKVPAGAATYVWASTPISVLPGTASITVSPIVNTTYTVTVTGAGGCTAVSTPVNITVSNPPVLSAITVTETSGVADDANICMNTSTVLKANSTTAGATYAWSSNPTSTLPALATITVVPTVTTIYTVSATVAGCSATAQRTVNVFQANAICKNATFKLNTPDVSISLADVNNGSLGTVVTIDKNTFSCLNIGANKVIITASNGFCVDTCNATVIISDGPGCSAAINALAPTGPSITDPCMCKGTSTTLQDGQFSDKVEVLNAFTNEKWAVKSVSGYYKIASAGQDPLNPVLIGDLMTEMVIGGGRSNFSLPGFHIDSIGYSIEVWRLDVSNVGIPGSELSTSNRCFYPTPVYRPLLPNIVPVSTPAFSVNLNVVDVNARNNTGGTVTSMGAGVIGNIFTAGAAGTYSFSTKLDYGNPTLTRTGKDINNPVCASTVAHTITVSNISPALVCKSHVNYTLTKDCYVAILPGDFLLGAPAGFGGYGLTIMEGQTVVNPAYIGTTGVGKTYTVKVEDLSTPKNSCWSTMKVEDKNAPIIDCFGSKLFNCEDVVKLNLTGVPDTVKDSNVGAFGKPTVNECNRYILKYYDQGVNGTCTDAFIFKGDRIFIALDEYGNTSTCAVPFEIRRRFLADVVFPTDKVLSCSVVTTSTVDTARGGQPTVLGKKFNLLRGCDLAATYTDVTTPNSCGVGYTIAREWVITSNCSAVPRKHTQSIVVKDFTAPLFANFPTDTIKVETNTSADCKANGVPLPLPSLSDNCDGAPSLTIRITKDGTQYGSGTIIWNLAPDSYIVRYTATDKCGNAAFMTRILVIQDKTAPNPVCQTNTIVSLARTDANVINATSIDAGSSDNCCLDVNRYEIKRMSEPDAAFKPTLNLRCADRDVMVVLRVWDCHGNSNTCMTNVLVNDKLAPLVVPENVTVTCGSDALAKVWFNDHPLKQLNEAPTTAKPGYFDHYTTDPTCIVTAKVTKEIDSLDNCGNGFYAQEWTVTDQAGNVTKAIQRYTSTNVSEFSVVFPKDTTIILNNQCDSVGVGVNIAGSARINILNNSCPVLTLDYFDQATKISEDSVCFSITRVWRVSNICRPMTGEATIVAHVKGKDVTVTANTANNGFFEYRQKINVIDLAPPTIESVPDVSFEPIDKLCKTRILLNPMSVKDCSAQRTIQSFVLSKADGTIVPTLSNALPATIDIDKADFGDYRVVYQVADACGNVATTSRTFKVKDVLKPTPVCHDNLAIEINPATKQAMLPAILVNAGSFDNCTSQANLKYRIRVLTDSVIIKNDIAIVNPDTLPGMFTFPCPPKGTPTGVATTWAIQLWVGDEAGNWDFCSTVIHLQDNGLVCNYDPNEMRPLDVEIKNEKGKLVEAVNVKLEGTKTMNFLSNKVGKVKFNDLPVGGSYQVIPEKKNFPLNGVSTFDLVLMTKHILGTQLFNTPYQFIAADINRSNSISTGDVVELRKMILGIQTDFSKNTSWRFVDQTYVFPNPAAPLNNSIPEKITLNSVGVNATAGFIGVKVGDINTSASVAGLTNGIPRTTNTNFFQTEEKTFRKDEIVAVNFSSKEELDGYQFTLNYDKNSLELVDIQENKEGFGIIENGILTLSQVVAENAEARFALTFKAKKDGKLSETIRATSNLISAEAYDKAGNINNVALKFNNTAATKFELYQNQPNPFNGTTTISFNLPENSTARLVISDVSGKTLKTMSGTFVKGYNQITLDKADLNTTGVLYYRLETATQTATKKMIILE